MTGALIPQPAQVNREGTFVLQISQLELTTALPVQPILGQLATASPSGERLIPTSSPHSGQVPSF